MSNKKENPSKAKKTMQKLAHKTKFWARNTYYKTAANTLEFGNMITQKDKKMTIPKDILAKWSRHDNKHDVLYGNSTLKSIKNRDDLEAYEEAKKSISNVVWEYASIEQKKEFINKYAKNLVEFPQLKKEKAAKVNTLEDYEKKLAKDMKVKYIPRENRIKNARFNAKAKLEQYLNHTILEHPGTDGKGIKNATLQNWIKANEKIKQEYMKIEKEYPEIAEEFKYRLRELNEHGEKLNEWANKQGIDPQKIREDVGIKKDVAGFNIPQRKDIAGFNIPQNKIDLVGLSKQNKSTINLMDELDGPKQLLSDRKMQVEPGEMDYNTPNNSKKVDISDIKSNISTNSPEKEIKKRNTLPNKGNKNDIQRRRSTGDLKKF